MTRNKLAKGIAIASVVAAAAFSLQAMALGLLREYTYYNDAAHTTEVGTKIISCSGQSTVSGQVTRYYTVTTESCY